jgi:hypothetical protein
MHKGESMKVWIGYEYSYDFCECRKTVAKVFDDEVKALLWKEDETFTKQNNQDFDWRDYEEYDVE